MARGGAKSFRNVFRFSPPVTLVGGVGAWDATDGKTATVIRVIGIFHWLGINSHRGAHRLTAARYALRTNGKHPVTFDWRPDNAVNSWPPAWCRD